MNVLKLFICFLLISSNYAFSIDQNRIVAFFNDYNTNPQVLDRLPFAIENGYDDIAEFLVLNGEPIKNYQIILDKTGGKGSNIFQKHPLITAIKNGYVSLSINMIKLIDDIDSINEYKLLHIHTVNSGWSRYDIDKLYALQAAIESPVGYPIIEELIASGVNLNARYSVLNSSLKNFSTTPLILSISNKKLNVASLLLEHAADANLSSTPWLYNNAPPVVSPLYVAVNDNYIEGINLLLTYEADPLKKTSTSDVSPMELAIDRELWDIVDLFLSIMNH
jgi:ankyrin repeat protein